MSSGSSCQSWSQDRWLPETVAANHGSTSLVRLEDHTTYFIHFLKGDVVLVAPNPFKVYSEHQNGNILGEA